MSPPAGAALKPLLDPLVAKPRNTTCRRTVVPGAGPLAAPSRSTLVLLTILASALPVAGARTATPADLVVGFAHLPAEVRAGHYGPDAVARVDEALGFAVVHAADAQATEARAHADPNVRYVQRDGVAHAEAIPNDPLYAQQYAWTHLNATGAWN